MRKFMSRKKRKDSSKVGGRKLLVEKCTVQKYLIWIKIIINDVEKYKLNKQWNESNRNSRNKITTEYVLQFYIKVVFR